MDLNVFGEGLDLDYILGLEDLAFLLEILVFLQDNPERETDVP